VAERVYKKREWIRAEDSYTGQAESLLAMVDRLSQQITEIDPRRPSRVSIVGIGASHAAAAAPVYTMRADGIDATRFLASELPSSFVASAGLTILVSQSGRSAEVVDLAVGASGQSLLAITNYHPSPLGEVCGSQLNLGNLPDSSVSFVSFTGTMLALGLLADRWAGRSEPGRWKAAIEQSMAAVMGAEDRLAEIASRLADAPSVDFVAPAPAVSAAEEAALMFREGPRIMATGMETRQYLHGPMDAAKTAAHVVFGGAREALLVDQLAEQTSKLVFVTGQGAGAPKVDTWLNLDLPVAAADGIQFAIAASFVAQRLTLHASAHRGIDINEAVFVRLDTKTDRAGTRAWP